MHLNDIGQWAVMWLDKWPGEPARSAWAFFTDRRLAVRFQSERGGELYTRAPDGSLKRV